MIKIWVLVIIVVCNTNVAVTTQEFIGADRCIKARDVINSDNNGILGYKKTVYCFEKGQHD